MKLISGSSNSPLATEIAQHLGINLLKTELTKFKNGEVRIWIDDQVENQEVIIIQSFSQPVDTNILETLLIADALERMGAQKVTLVLPWMGYSLQDKIFRQGEPIAAKVIADLISRSFIHRCFLLDLHNPSIPGFFTIPTHHLSAINLFADYAQKHFDKNNIVVVSPDFGGLKRAREFAKILAVDLANIDKHRDLNTGEVTAVGLHGEVSGKTVLLFDDCILSGSTVVETAELLKQQGAKEVHFLATHGLFTGEAVAKIDNSQVDSVVITDSINQQKINQKIKVISIAQMVGEKIKA